MNLVNDVTQKQQRQPIQQPVISLTRLKELVAAVEEKKKEHETFTALTVDVTPNYLLTITIDPDYNEDQLEMFNKGNER